MKKQSLRTDKIKLQPTVYGVGCFGVGHHTSRDNGKCSVKYRTWQNMLKRCYCPKEQERTPTYNGVTVCDEWHNYQNFADWFDLNYIKGHNLDKDVKQRGVNNKIYSPSTCIFITKGENSTEAAARYHVVRSPNGTIHVIYNMSKHCRDNGLNKSCMSDVLLGKRSHHRSWTKYI